MRLGNCCKEMFLVGIENTSGINDKEDELMYN
jgi:hypothetical protein